MKLTTILLGAIACTAQAVIDTTMCEVGANPGKFDGKLIRVRATHRSGFEHSLLTGCEVSMWLSIDQMPQLLTGEVAPVRTPDDIKSPERLQWRRLPPRVAVSVLPDAGWKAFEKEIGRQRDRHMAAKRPSGAATSVTATFVGRFDWLGGRLVAYRAEGSKQITLKLGGFGHLNAAPMQLVVQRISNVEPQ
jgi:hypothetical protein